MHFYTIQQAADYAVKKIVEQGGQCMAPMRPDDEDDDELECAYSDDHGNHCAIGWLLDHDNPALMTYKGSLQSMADMCWAGFDDYPLPELIKENINFFNALQDFHDEKFASRREVILEDLQENWGDSINFSSNHWQQWVNMGADNDY